MAKITDSRPVDGVSTTSRRAINKTIKIAGTNHMSTQSPNLHRQQPRAEMYPRTISVSGSPPLQKVKYYNYCNISCFSSYNYLN